MSGVAEITIVGNVGRDAEVRYTPSGKSVTTLSVAVSSGKKNSDGTWTSETDWFRVTIFGETGERMSEQLRKGARVLVIGRFKAREWEKDGKRGTALEIVSSKVVPLDRREHGEAPGGSSAATEGEGDLSSLPF